MAQDCFCCCGLIKIKILVGQQFLHSVSVMAAVSDTVIAIRDQFRGKFGQTKVRRYWPGKAPEWAGDKNDDADHVTIPAVVDKFFDCKKR